MNPFIIQGSALMPFGYTLIFIVLAFIFGFICKNPIDVIFYIALDLFLCITFYVTYQMIIQGSIVNSFFDMSYFIFCIPFALLCTVKKQENVVENQTFIHK
jgi:hypothetical protein